jgi:hypothetical protein
MDDKKRRYRHTLRKNLIMRVLAEEFPEMPVVLEELRWRVLLSEQARDGVTIEMTRSYRNSFARTIREHLPALFLHKLTRLDEIPIGILARSAVYRCESEIAISQIESSISVSAIFELKRGGREANSSDDAPFLKILNDKSRIDPRKMIYSWIRLTDHNTSPYVVEDWITRACLPCNSPITLVTIGRDALVLERVSSVNWMIYQHVRHQLFHRKSNECLNSRRT